MQISRLDGRQVCIKDRWGRAGPCRAGQGHGRQVCIYDRWGRAEQGPGAEARLRVATDQGHGQQVRTYDS